MQKIKIFSVVFLFCVFCIGVSSMAEEITLTTYYPAPYGAYEELSVSGSLGIGTSEPRAKLHVKSETNGVSGYFTDESTTTFLIGHKLGNAVGIGAFGTSNDSSDDVAIGRFDYRDFDFTENVRFKGGSGNVGIGTDDPGSKLHVTGDIKANSYSVGANSGASGNFRTVDNKRVTVTNGIITSIR